MKSSAKALSTICLSLSLSLTMCHIHTLPSLTPPTPPATALHVHRGVPLTPSAALLKATLINSASSLSDPFMASLFSTTPLPLDALRASGGFGVPSLVRGLPLLGLRENSPNSAAPLNLILPGLFLHQPTASASPSPSPSVVPKATEPALSLPGQSHIYCVDTSFPELTTSPSSALVRLPFRVIFFLWWELLQKEKYTFPR